MADATKLLQYASEIFREACKKVGYNQQMEQSGGGVFSGCRGNYSFKIRAKPNGDPEIYEIRGLKTWKNAVRSAIKEYDANKK